jgi:iron complex outermembrane receptor protein
MNAKFLLVVVLFCYISAFTQVISGIVTDKQNNNKLPGVNIYNLETKKGTVTDINGQFILSLKKQGLYTLQFSYIGYTTELKKINVNADTVYVLIEMKPSVIEAKEVVVSAAYQSSQNEIPIPIKKISAKEITETGEVNLTQALARIPGVNTLSTGVSIGKPQIRGLSYNRVLIYAMGIPIDNQQWGDEHGLSITDLGTDGVEIIKGPASLIYGADAMGGVIHFIDQKPAKINTIEGDVKQEYFTNTNGTSSKLLLKTSLKNIRFGFGASFQNHADYKQANGIRVTNTRFNNTAVKGTVGFILKNWISDWHYAYNQSALGIPEEINFQNIDKNLLAPNQLVTDNILASSNTFFIGKHKLKVNMGLLSNVRKEFEDESFNVKLFRPVTDSSALSMQLHTANYDLKWYFPAIKNWEIILGSQGKIQKNKNFNNQEYLIPNAEVSQTGFFGLFKYSKDVFSFLSGIRYDLKNIYSEQMGVVNDDGYMPSLSLHYANINGSAGISYFTSEKIKIQLNIASGFRAPNLAELSSNGIHEGTFRYEIGNPNLKIEQNVEPDFIIEYEGKHMSFSTNLFYNRIFNYIYLSPTNKYINNTKVYTYEQNNAALYGAEFSADIHPHPYDWLHTEINFATVTGVLENGEYLPRIPANNLSIKFKAEVLKNKKRWSDMYISVTPDYYFPKNNFAQNELYTPDYLLLNIALGGNFSQNWQWFISGKNILNKQYVSHLSRLKYEGIGNMGRNITFGLTYSFGVKM